jgi:putative membrane protein
MMSWEVEPMLRYINCQGFGCGPHVFAWLIGGLFLLLLLILVLGGLLFLLRGFRHTGRMYGPIGHMDIPPERILARRFAAGMISEEEFHRRLDVLRQHDTAPH